MKRSKSNRPIQLVWDLLADLPGAKPHRCGERYFVNTFFPPYPSEAFHRFCHNAFNGLRAPGTTYLAVTAACPADCDHCSYGGRSGEAMGTEQMVDLIGQIKALGGHTLGLTGGEPMLRDDLEELIAAAAPEMSTLVFTTGWGLDEARARGLVDVGLTALTVGVDSADASRHDAIRKREGSFEEARSGIAAAQAAGLYTAISAVASRERLADGELQRLYDLARQWDVCEFRINSPIATGAMAGQADRMLTAEELAQLEAFTHAHNDSPDGPVVTALSVLESAGLFGCGAGHHHLFIDAAGNVCPCDLTPMSFGNVIDEPLTDIWERMGEHFALPRTECIMRTCASKIQPGQQLPLPPEQTADQCPQRCDSEPLPEIYRRLQEVRAKYLAEVDQV